VEINLGDTVVWVDNDPDFPTYVTSDVNFGQPNYFKIPLIEEGDARGFDFNYLGTFGYHDDWGHNGSVTVTAAAQTINLVTTGISGNKFLFDATGLNTSKTYVVETSTNLVVWNPIQTNVASSSSMSFTNPVSAGSHFFRLQEQP